MAQTGIMTSEQVAPQQGRSEERPAVPADAAWPRRLALLLIAGLAGLSYAWALGQDRWSPITRPRSAACR
jgi:hypothetical protein